jgi:hypothetical protein
MASRQAARKKKKRRRLFESRVPRYDLIELALEHD